MVPGYPVVDHGSMPQSRLGLALYAIVFAGAAMPHLAAAGDADGAQAPDNPATAHELPQITVIANVPLSGLGLPLNQVPANVQTADSKDLQRQQALGVADYLNSNFSGINVNESADNPFQLDVNYHGFTASPLLGTPQGLSVYVDGVRLNESFGDTVNWDLIPESAISTVTLVSGSNPVFGLNTLGGALAIQTKSGHDNPGTEFEAYGGSFGRRNFQAQTGGEAGNFDYFLTGNYFDETGWRDVSPTQVYQGFGKVGWQNDKTDVDLSYTYADTHLYGNGATPQSMLDYRRAASYTPDFTQNLLNFANLTGTQFLSGDLLLSANVYYRHLITGSSNGNVNDDYLSSDYSGPPIDCTLAAANRVDLDYCSPAQNAVSRLVQRTAGFGVQLTDSQDVFGWKNQGVLGTDYTDSRDAFGQMFQFGEFAPNRTLIYDINPLNDETVISLGGSNKISGIYLTDTLSPGKLLHVTASVRYNRNTETLDGSSVDTDVGDAGAGFDTAGPLAGNHTFSRINPALGFTVTPIDTLTFYADYNEASRAPTAIELGCSNPAAPCGLPNDFASDPDLKQVVARTVELGARGNSADKTLNWSVDVFRTVNSDDIQFVATSTNQGYFDNVGDTRRQGADFSLSGKLSGLSWRLVYSFVDATFQSNFEVNAESNSTADENGNIQVRPGDRIPLIARHTGRLVLDYAAGDRWDVGANVIASSGVFLHGDENNANQAGGINGEGAVVQGSGWISGYAVLNLNGTYHLGKAVDLFARVANVFDKQYATAGFLTSNSFNPNGTFRADPAAWTNENAVSPAQPRAVWVGMRLRW
jgi:outer membrane receptor protein involved in Fe transport